MEIHIEQLPIYHIAYMRKIGPYGYENAALMGALKKWAMARDLLTESATILGIAHDDPEVTPPEKCRYDACIVLPQEHPFDNSINENSLPGGKYAILSVEHTAEAIGKAWNYAFTKWLPDSGFEIDERPIFERYAAEAAVCDLCIPVKPL